MTPEIDFIIERRIIQIGNERVNRRDNNLRKSDLTSVQSETLLFFDRNEGKSIGELKDYLKITHQAARNLVERLKNKNYLYLEIMEGDARCKGVYLTGEGHRICEELKKEGTGEGKQLLRGFSEQEKIQLLELLERMKKNV